MSCSKLYRRGISLVAQPLCYLVASTLVACGPAPDGMLLDALDSAALFDTPGLVFTSGTCTYGATNGNLTVSLAPSNVIMIGTLSSSPFSITINGNATYCGNANITNTKAMDISVQGGGVGTSETVVISYANGYFAQKSSATVSGTTWDTGGQNAGADADALEIVTPSIGNANMTLGATGVHLAGTSLVDIAFLNSHNPNFFQVSFAGGNDRFSGLGDSLVGGAAQTRVVLNGGAGNDNFFTSGGNYNDIYNGGDGNDTITVAAAVTTAHMSIDGGNNFDTVSWAARTLPVALRIGSGFVSGDTAGAEQHSITSTVESLIGGSGDDILQGNAAGTNTVLYGGPGNDNFYQGGASADSNDTLWGGPGIDLVNYSGRTCAVTVSLDGNPNDGCRAATGEIDNVQLDVENITTGTGADTIVGNSNDNVINAGGGGGTNNVWGMAGDDTFMQDALATDIVSGGAGQDTVSYQNRGAFVITAVLDGVTASGQTTGGEADILGTDVENLIGSASTTANTLTGNSGDNVISGAGSGTNTIDCQGGLDIAIHGTTVSNCEIVVH